MVAKFSLALFSAALGVICIVLYSTSPSNCNHYGVCFVLLAIFHLLDSIGYIHDGYKAVNDGFGVFGVFSGKQDEEYTASKFSERDIIYVNKSKEEGMQELKDLGRKTMFTFTIGVLLYGFVVFIYV